MKKFINSKVLFPILFLLIPTLHFSQSNGQKSATEKYYRHLKYNHVSPHIPIKGIHEISSDIAKNTSHYIFKYDVSNKLIEIVNYHYHGKRQHPLATIGAFKTIFSYADRLETRIFFDIKGNRTTNDRGVYKEQYKQDKNGFIYALDFYDLDNKPAESNWNITNYVWSKHKELVIERRYNLKKELVTISPYFEFGITGILYRKDGSPKANYNLNEKLEVQENSDGVASYHDSYDEFGNHITYSYHDAKGRLTQNQWDYALAKQEYDDMGYLTTEARFNEDKSLIDKINIPSPLKTTLATIASKKDSIEIREKALGYLIALQQLKPDLMKNVFHKDLAKRTLGYKGSIEDQIIRETTYEQMIKFAESWNRSGTKFPPVPTNQVKILDIYDHIAAVKLISDNWVEHLHLIKISGQWKIINLLWQYKNVDSYFD